MFLITDRYAKCRLTGPGAPVKLLNLAKAFSHGRMAVTKENWSEICQVKRDMQ